MAKKIESMILLSYLFIFLVNFWVYHFFQNFDVFSWFRKLPMDPNWCFFMPWWSRDHPRLILDGFGKSHCFNKIFKILSHMMRPTFLKTHMYIHTLVNLRVPRPQATQNAKTKWSSSNSNRQMLRKLKNKIEKSPKVGTKYISNAKRAVNRQPGYRAEDS